MGNRPIRLSLEDRCALVMGREIMRALKYEVTIEQLSEKLNEYETEKKKEAKKAALKTAASRVKKTTKDGEDGDES